MEIGGAGNRPRALLGLGQGGQQHRGENGDDGDDDKQFDQGKSVPSSRPAVHWARFGFSLGFSADKDPYKTHAGAVLASNVPERISVGGNWNE